MSLETLHLFSDAAHLLTKFNEKIYLKGYF